MVLPAQRSLARLSGYEAGRPIYAATCETPGVGRVLTRLIGFSAARPVYALADCLGVMSGSGAESGSGSAGRRLTRLIGFSAGRPIYAFTCCTQSHYYSGSGVLPAGAHIPSSVSTLSGSGLGSGQVSGGGSLLNLRPS